MLSVYAYFYALIRSNVTTHRRWTFATCPTIACGLAILCLLIPDVIQGQPVFTDFTARTGLPDGGSVGAAWFDFNNDGLEDLIVTGEAEDGDTQAELYTLSQGRFLDLTDGSGLATDNAMGVAVGDYNNDGLVDVFTAGGNGANRLLRNNGDGTFTDVSAIAGLEGPDSQTKVTASFADYDRDGFIDLYVGTESGSDALYRNNGDDTFTDVTSAAGLSVDINTVAQTFTDFDNDGWPDLYVSHRWDVNGPVRAQLDGLYANNGDGTFTNVMGASGISLITAIAEDIAILDYDNDGRQDLFLATTGRLLQRSHLYRNTGSFTFQDVSTEAGIDEMRLSFSLTSADYDGDGWQDIYLDRGRLYTNNGTGSFTETGDEAGLRIINHASVAINGDYDEDGFPDMFHVVPGAGLPNVLYRNEGNQNRWLRLHLVGQSSNRSAIGARVIVQAGGRSMTREVGGGNGRGSKSFVLSYGLGSSTLANEVTVQWALRPDADRPGRAGEQPRPNHRRGNRLPHLPAAGVEFIDSERCVRRRNFRCADHRDSPLVRS